MTSPLLHRLRRCRALFALALCAWLALGSAVWARSGCCASMDMHNMHAMTSAHADHHHGGHPQKLDTDNGACTCAHAAVDQLTPVPRVAGFQLPDPFYARALPQDAPHPVFAPPLRPPAA